jgi:hypothetical protein
MAKRYMKRRVQVEWYGDDFTAVVDQYGDEALFAAGQIVLADAQRRAPRGPTGNLRKSGYVGTKDRSSYMWRRYWRKEKRPPKGSAVVAFTAPHAHLVEGGRRRAGAIVPKRRRALKIGDRFVSHSRFRRYSSRPFLGPAIDATRETLVAELAGVLRRRLEEKLPGAR